MEGLKFNRLTVIKYSYSFKHNRFWECICDCGKTTFVSTDNIRRNNTKSCGCLKTEKSTININTHAKTHGLSRSKTGKHTKLYMVWSSLKSRCNNPNHHAYKNYGGRGITVCDEWNNYLEFHKWAVENGYKEGLSIDRIKNNLGYNPDNCKWSTDKEQMRNRNCCNLITHDNITKTISAWAEDNGMSVQCLRQRLKKWSFDKSISIPIKKNLKPL